MKDWFWSRFSTAYGQLVEERNNLRRWQAEYADTLRAIYEQQQAWKKRALAAEARLSQAMRSRHPSCQMSEREVNEMLTDIRGLPEVES